MDPSQPELKHVVYSTGFAIVVCECEDHGCLHCAGEGVRYLYPDELAEMRRVIFDAFERRQW